MNPGIIFIVVKKQPKLEQPKCASVEDWLHTFDTFILWNSSQWLKRTR